MYQFLQAFPGYTAQTMAEEDAGVVRDLLALQAGIAKGQAAKARRP